MEIRNIDILELDTKIFAPFNRYQEVFQKWVREDTEWVLKNVTEVRDWSDEKKEGLTNWFRRCLNQGDVLLGAFENNELIGFALIGSKLCGSSSMYVNLSMLFVTSGKRSLGIGLQLFNAGCDTASMLGADKLFISAYAAKDTVDFYKKIGCINAIEVISEFIESPEDYYLEYIV